MRQLHRTFPVLPLLCASLAMILRKTMFLANAVQCTAALTVCVSCLTCMFSMFGWVCRQAYIIYNTVSIYEWYISIYIFENVCLFVCLFAVNAKTTERIDSKRSGITKNDPESVLYRLKSPVLVLSGRYDISGFPFAAARHFYFHFRLLRRRLAIKTASTARHVAREPSHLEQKCYC